MMDETRLAEIEGHCKIPGYRPWRYDVKDLLAAYRKVLEKPDYPHEEIDEMFKENQRLLDALEDAKIDDDEISVGDGYDKVQTETIRVFKKGYKTTFARWERISEHNAAIERAQGGKEG